MILVIVRFLSLIFLVLYCRIEEQQGDKATSVNWLAPAQLFT